jgi:hypothetical protein
MHKMSRWWFVTIKHTFKFVGVWAQGVVLRGSEMARHFIQKEVIYQGLFKLVL